MRINTLELTDITRYEHTIMQFPDPVTVIVGHNAAGKTTVPDAIRQALTGECARTEKGGGKQERMVRTGSQQGSISLSVYTDGDEPIVVTRFVPGELLVEGQHGNKTQLQKNICDALGIELGVLSAALSTPAILEMSSSELKRMFFGLLGLSFEKDALLKRIADELARNARVVEEACAFIAAAPTDLWTGDSKTFDKLYKYCYDLRRDVNRDIKNLGELPPQMKLMSDLPDKAEVVEQLQALRREKSALEQAVGAARANVGTRDRLVSEIGQLRERLEDAGDPEKAQAELKKLEPQMSDLKRELDALADAAKDYTDVAQAFEESPSCPMSSKLAEPIACGMAKTKREKIIANLHERAHEAVDVKYPEVKAKIGELKETLADLEASAYKPSRTELEAAIEAKEADLAALPVTDVDLPKHEREISELAARTAKGEELLADINRSEGATEAQAAQIEKRRKLEAQSEVLDALVKVLSSQGLPGKILDESIGPIQEQANARLSALTGGRYQLRLEVDPDFAIIVDHDGVSSPLGLLSSSEQQRVGIILQDAIVRLSGLRFLIVDEADKLDPENRALLTEYLLDIADDYDQIIVLATIGSDGVHRPDPPIDGLGIYKLEDGQLREVE